MSPRTGRPTDNPKKGRLEIRVSDEEEQMMRYCCEALGKTRSDVIREGVDALFEKIKREQERRVGMYSFYDINGAVIPFENRTELSLQLQKDVVSGKVTAYLVECDDRIYQVDKKTYDVLENM